ncbi:MAG TPA: xanthine dehydrogenase family protein subunit M, partial [Caldithrix sp.]|nr:xanthine dehydrogenase family protein subunit M [Caldithrix sp.]
MQFSYIQPTSIEEVFKLGSAAPLYAGGTDLIGLMKDDIIKTDKVINIKKLKGLDK